MSNLGRPKKYDPEKIKNLYYNRVAENAYSKKKETRKQIASHIGCSLQALERSLYN